MPFDDRPHLDHVLTSDGTLEDIRPANDERNAAHVIVRIPAHEAFLDRVRADHTLANVCLRSKIARSGYELEHHPLDTDIAADALVVHGRVRPLVKNYPTYRHPVHEVFQPGQRFARAFYEDPDRRLDAEAIQVAIKQKRLRFYNPDYRVMPDGTVAVPVERLRYIWQGPRAELRETMHDLLTGNITREGLTAGQLLTPKRDPHLTIHPGDAVITHARFATDFHTIIIKENEGHTHFEARLLDPGSGHPDRATGENNAIKLELANRGKRTITPRHVLMRFYDVPTA